MRKFVKKAAAALLAGTMAMSLTACAGFTPSGGNDKKDTTASSEAGADTGVTQAAQTSGAKKTIKFSTDFLMNRSMALLKARLLNMRKRIPILTL